MFLALALAAQTAPNAPLNGSWIEIGRDENQVDYVEARPIRTEGVLKLIWTRVDFSRPLSDGSWSALYQIEVDCSARTTWVVAFIGQDREGNALVGRAVADAPHEPVTRDTGGETVYNRACSDAR